MLNRDSLVEMFDLARHEGMLKSKDGIHSRFSEDEAEDILEHCQSCKAQILKEVKEEIMPLVNELREVGDTLREVGDWDLFLNELDKVWKSKRGE